MDTSGWLASSCELRLESPNVVLVSAAWTDAVAAAAEVLTSVFDTSVVMSEEEAVPEEKELVDMAEGTPFSDLPRLVSRGLVGVRQMFGCVNQRSSVRAIGVKAHIWLRLMKPSTREPTA